MKIWPIAGLAVAAVLFLVFAPKEEPRREVPHRTPPKQETPAPPVAPTLPPPTIERSPAELRADAATKPDALQALIDLINDPSADFTRRARAALILGSLDDDRAWKALLTALDAAKEPAWARVLILAIGSDRDPQPEGFGNEEPGSPWVVEIAGMRVRVIHDITRAEVRERLARFLTHADADLREAAITSLYHSMEHVDTRRSLAAVMEGDPSDEPKAHAAKAVGEWIQRQPEPTAERIELTTRLLGQAARPEQTLMRVRTAAHLGAVQLSDAEARTLLPMAASGDAEVRRWSLELLGDVAAHMPSAFPDEVRVLARAIVTSDPDPKLRILAVRTVGRLGGADAASILIQALSDPEPFVRQQAVRQLKALPQTPEIEAALQRAATE